MKLENLKEKEVTLLGRKRVRFELEHQGQSTPTKISIKEEIAKKYNTKPELVAIRHIYSKFGSTKAKVIAHIYNDEKSLKFLEPPKGKKVEAKKAA